MIDFDAIQFLIEDKSLITYRPKLNEMTGSVLATILLQQCLYWWGKSGRKKFYKFKEKCNHSLYKEGDSWCEELGFTKYEFDSAIKGIGFKLGKTQNLIKKEEAFIVYYRDKQDLTWYDINPDYLEKRLNSIYLVSGQNRFTKQVAKTDLLTNTETTTETTSKQQSKSENAVDVNFKIKEIKDQLIGLDFGKEFIERLVREHSLKKIEEKLELLKEKKDIINKTGWLLVALKNDYQGIKRDRGRDDDGPELWKVKPDLTKEEKERSFKAFLKNKKELFQSFSVIPDVVMAGSS